MNKDARATDMLETADKSKETSENRLMIEFCMNSRFIPISDKIEIINKRIRDGAGLEEIEDYVRQVMERAEPPGVRKNNEEMEQAIERLLSGLKRAEESAESEGWIDAEDVKRELGILD